MDACREKGVALMGQDDDRDVDLLRWMKERYALKREIEMESEEEENGGENLGVGRLFGE